MAKHGQKIEWLRAVYEAKETLFGAFSDKLTKSEKITAWKVLHSKAQALALVPNNKEYSYTRDTFWQNLRKIAMKKRDNSRATGSGTTKFTEVDEMVYQIIGKESPTLIGLPVLESGEIDPLIGVDESGSTFTASTSTEVAQCPNRIVANNMPPVHKPNELKKKYDDLKLKKMDLMIKLLKKENYLKKLKIIKLQKELNSPTLEENKEEERASLCSTDEDSYDVEYLNDSD